MNGCHSKLPAQPSTETRKLQMKITASERGPIRLVKFDKIKATEPEQEIIDLSDDDEEDISENASKRIKIETEEIANTNSTSEFEYEVLVLNNQTTSLKNELKNICDKIDNVKSKDLTKFAFRFQNVKDAFKFYNVLNPMKINGEPLVVLFPVQIASKH